MARRRGQTVRLVTFRNTLLPEQQSSFDSLTSRVLPGGRGHEAGKDDMGPGNGVAGNSRGRIGIGPWARPLPRLACAFRSLHRRPGLLVLPGPLLLLPTLLRAGGRSPGVACSVRRARRYARRAGTGPRLLVLLPRSESLLPVREAVPGGLAARGAAAAELMRCESR